MAKVTVNGKTYDSYAGLVYHYTPPEHARSWYQTNACPACGNVNGTGIPCNITRRCKGCRNTVCTNTENRCPLCGEQLEKI